MMVKEVTVVTKMLYQVPLNGAGKTFEAGHNFTFVGGAERIQMRLVMVRLLMPRLAIANGVYVVAAAGNDGGPEDDGKVSTPSNVNEVISVALDRDGDVWSGSSLGGELDSSGEERQDPHKKPEIAAPGVDIISTAFDDEYYSSTGTSDSTVFVSGILALILKQNLT